MADRRAERTVADGGFTMRMAFAAELGGGLGHASRLAPWRACFEARGVETLALMPDLRVVAQAPGLAAPPCMQAPRLAHGPSIPDFDPGSYAELLIGAGYGNRAVLAALVDAWRHTFRLARVDAVVLDHAPTALLAARVAGIPVMQIGDGFTLPGPGQAGLAYEPAAAKRDPERYVRAARTALSSINAVLEAHAAPTLPSLDAFLGGTMTVIASYPELDHRPGARAADDFAGHFGVAAPDTGGWKAIPGPRVFAYLKPGGAGFEATIAALGRHAGQVRIHAQGIAGRDVPGAAAWEWSSQPLPTGALEGCDLVVCHAGHGTVCEALLAGKPLFLLPQVFEQMLTAQNVAALGAGAWFHPAQDLRTLRRGLRQVIEGGGYREAAQAFARRHGNPAGRAARLAEIADRFLALAGRAGSG